MKKSVPRLFICVLLSTFYPILYPGLVYADCQGKAITAPKNGTGGCTIRTRTYNPLTKKDTWTTDLNKACQGTPGDDELTCMSAGCVADADKGNDKITVDPSVSSQNQAIYLCGNFGDDQIIGSNFQDFIDGGPGQDVLLGLDGDDSIFGGLGDDTIDGGYGNDILNGGIGDDSIYGDGNLIFTAAKSFNDTIIGGPGDDTMDGGPHRVITSGVQIVSKGDTCSLGSSPYAIGDTRINCEAFGQ